jgi:hypothetical protein
MITWEWVELIWTVVNTLGILGNVRLIVVAWRKRAASLAAGHQVGGPSILSADRYIRNDVGRLLCHAIGVLVGLWALVTHNRDWLLTVVTGWGAVLIVAILMGLAILDLLDEIRLDRLLGREQEQGGRRGGMRGHAR